MRHIFQQQRVKLSIGLMLLALMGTAPIVNASTIEITASVLNVRTGAGTTNQLIGTVRKGQLYYSHQKQGAWHLIDFDQRKAWIHGSHVRPSTAKSVSVTTSKLNVRTGAGSGYRDVGDTFNGQKWVVRSRSGTWSKVDYRGGSYWMHSGYLSGGVPNPGPDPDLPSSSAGLVQVPSSGTGFYAYAEARKRWGTPKMVYGLLRAAKKRISDNRNQGRVSIGNISRSDGSKPSTVHKTHYSGKFADMRPIGKGTYEGRIDIREAGNQYSRDRTRTWIRNYLKNEFGGSIQTVLFNDRSLINEGLSRYVSGHHNHIHLQVN